MKWKKKSVFFWNFLYIDILGANILWFLLWVCIWDNLQFILCQFNKINVTVWYVLRQYIKPWNIELTSLLSGENNILKFIIITNKNVCKLKYFLLYFLKDGVNYEIDFVLKLEIYVKWNLILIMKNFFYTWQSRIVI